EIIMQESAQNVILRTTVIYGWHVRSRFTNWVLNSLKNKKTVCAFTDQHSTPTLVDDLAKSIIKMIELGITGVHHAVGKTCLSRYEFALKLADRFGFDKSLIIPTISSEKKQIALRPLNGCLDGSKLEKLIGYDFCDIDSGISFMLSKSNGHSQVF
ncbi:MAG: sugar nucleotide-binding protein, partial [Nitrosopumilaceae archaeon]